MDSPHQKARTGTMTRILFALLCLLLLTAVFIRSNLRNEETVQGLQIGMIIVTMGLGLLELRRNNRGLQKLAEVAKEIGKGQYAARADRCGKDALGMLGNAINQMAQRIESAIHQAETSQRELASSKETLDRQNQQLSRVVERQAQFGRFLADLNTIEINTLANRALKHIMLAANAPLGAFYLVEDSGKKIACLAAEGVDERALRQLSSTNGLESLPGRCVAQQKWIFVEAPEGQPALELDLGVGRVTARAVFAAPISFRDSVLGVVVLACLSRPDEPTLEYLRNQTDALSNGLNNALSYKAINRQSVLLERANEELRRADRLRSEFVANMSHELRTPLNSIIGFSGIMLKNRSGKLDEGDLKRAEKINRNGKHLLNLINDILDLSKVEAGRMDVAIAPVSLGSLVREVTDILLPQAEAKGLQLRCEGMEKDQVIQSDGQKLKQVLINLGGNAIKFTHEGSVTFRLSERKAEGDDVLIQVIDTGIGIPAEKLDLIFEAFRQADGSTTREYGGTGLGLTISRSFVSLLGGTVTASSEVGKGSTFTLRLPSQPPNGIAITETDEAPVQTSPPPRDAVEEKRSGKGQAADQLLGAVHEALTSSVPVRPGQKVLVIDDDADAQDLIGHYLSELGARVIPCRNSGTATRMAFEHKPDLISLDLMMPEKSGWEVLALLKAEPSLRDIPVIIVSILADRRKAISLGAVDALTKPIIRADFQACVERNFRRNTAKSGKVLVVDDDADARQLITTWLEPHVTEVKSARNGDDALKLLGSFVPDIIFLDLQMPVMDGATFLRELRRNERFEKIPVVIVTAKTLEREEYAHLERNVSKILMKGEIF